MTYTEIKILLQSRILELDRLIKDAEEYGAASRARFLRVTLDLNKQMLYLLTLN